MINDYKNFVDRMGSSEEIIDLSNDDLDLKHFGIPGMKWGHHKAVNANVIGKAAKTGQDLATLGQTVNKGGFNKKALKDAKSMSDDELKQLTTRLNLENNYINAKNQQAGRSKVESILATTGSALAVASSAAVLYDVIKKLR